MPSTTFIDGTTKLIASWLNPVNTVIHSLLGDGTNAPTTKADLRTNIGATTVGDAVFTATSTGNAQTSLGGSTLGKTIFTTANEASAQTALLVPSRNDIVGQNWTAFTTAGTSTAYTITPSTWGGAYTAGNSFFITFHTASGNNPTITIGGVASPPNLVRETSDGSFTNILANEITANHRSRVTLISSTQALVETLPSVILDYAVLQTSANNDTTNAFATFASSSTKNMTVNTSTGQITLLPGIYQITAHVVPISGFSLSEIVQRGLRFNKVSGTTFLPNTGGILYSGLQYLLITGSTGEGWTLSGTVGVSATAVYSLNSIASGAGKFLRCEYLSAVRLS
jgi:hypothetical protein